MGLLGDFAGAFLSNVGNEMYDNERQQQALALQEALEARRIQRQQEAELRRRKQQNEDESVKLNMQGPQVGVDDAGNQGLLRIRSSVDPESGALRAERERVGDAPITPVGRPMTIYDGANRRSVQRYSDGSEKDLGAPSPVRAASGGGSSSTKVRTVTNSDGSKTDYDPNTGAELKHFPAKGGGGKKDGDKPEDVRKLWDDEITRASELEGRALLSKAKQYGITEPRFDGVGTAPPVDEEAVRAALLDKIDAKYGSRLKSSGASGGAGVGKPDDASAAQLKTPPQDVLSQAKNAIKNGASAESVRERLRKNGYSDEGI